MYPRRGGHEAFSGRALARLQIRMRLFAQGMTQDISVISRHCNVLFDAELVTRTKDGRRTVYAPTEIVVTKLKAITAHFETLLKKWNE